MSPTAPTISIIMPAYNVEAYVRRAVESLQKQSYRNFELLVVDDGSRDRTASILDSIAERDIRINVFHTQNAGAPAARNFALDRARGKWLMFMDADDWVEPRMLEQMLEFAEKHQLEMVVAPFYIDTYYGDEGQYTTELKTVPAKVYPDQESFRKDAFKLFDQNLFYPPWNKLFLRQRVEDLHIRFKATFWDDFPFVLDNIRDIERVGVCEKPYYHFIRQRAESETARFRPEMYDKREEEHGWMLDLYQHWGLESDEDSQEMIQRRYIERLVGCVENLCNPASGLKRAEKIRRIKQIISTNNAREAVRYAKPKSKMMALMLAPIAAQNAWLTYQEGSFISFVKRHNTKLFATLKAKR